MSMSGSSIASLPGHQMGEVLGKGAFGCVYRALNWTTGETLAVKQIGLSNIPKSDLPEIMSEIDLLKNLDHPNIVQYRGFVKSKDFLYIILEYCENGSLHAVLKKFGRIPEALVAVYIYQILEGLLYLHDQGVIHRDIKGSNILATKEGSVKLADFGVATRTGGMMDHAVVGSPYWMAPEVVDQSGATTASDIWSLGCLVIELMEGKPPYSFLDPMPALFRIVNDDCPPIPEGASNVARDFLLQCFQKDVNLRISARKLLRHPWMAGAKRQLDQNKKEQASRNRPFGAHEETVQRVQEWNKATDTNLAKASLSDLQGPNWRPATRPSEEVVYALESRSHHHANVSSRAPPSKALPLRPVTNRSSPSKSQTQSGQPNHSIGVENGIAPSFGLVVGSSGSPLPLTASKIGERGPGAAQKEVLEDNWDADFEEGVISMSKIANKGLEREPAGPSDPHGSPELKAEHDDNTDTIRPGASSVPTKAHSAAASQMPAILEDYSDLVSEDEHDPFQGRVESLRMHNKAQKRIFHPRDISAGSTSSSNSSTVTDLSQLRRKTSPASTTSGARSSSPGRARSNSPTPSFSERIGGNSRKAASPVLGRRASASSLSTLVAADELRRSTPSPDPSPSAFSTSSSSTTLAERKDSIEKYSEAGNEDYSDVFVKVTGTGLGAPSSQTLKLNTRLSNRSWLGDEDSDEDDPFAEVEDSFDDGDLETNMNRDKLARLSYFVTEVINAMHSGDDMDEEALQNACVTLIDCLETFEETRSYFTKAHGLLAVIEALQSPRGRGVLHALLQIFNKVVGDDAEALEKICLVGGCPVVMSFASDKYSAEIRLQAAFFVSAMCRTSLMTLQMFISCGGIKVLVELMDDNYQERKDLVWMALDGILQVFELQTRIPKSDFCRMFANEGLIEPLSGALVHAALDNDDFAESTKEKIVDILLIFAQSDLKVKEAMVTRPVALRLVRVLSLLSDELLAPMLKTIKHITMSPNSLNTLQNANVIDVLVHILEEHCEAIPANGGQMTPGTEICNHIVNALYNLCRLNPSRQEEAAQAGAIPVLQRIVKASSTLRHFALPILCDFAHTSKTCRKMLWQNDGLKFYLEVLKDPFWSLSALEAILVWLNDETARVEDALLTDASIDALTRVFLKAKASTFEHLLDALVRILRASAAISARLALQTSFVKRLTERLASHSKAVVRLNLLKIIKTIYEAVPGRSRSSLAKHPGLAELVQKLAESDGAILVRELAKEISKEFVKDAATGTLGRAGGTPSTGKPLARIMRRASSETSVSTPGSMPMSNSVSSGMAGTSMTRSERAGRLLDQMFGNPAANGQRQ